MRDFVWDVMKKNREQKAKASLKKLFASKRKIIVVDFHTDVHKKNDVMCNGIPMDYQQFTTDEFDDDEKYAFYAAEVEAK